MKNELIKFISELCDKAEAYDLLPKQAGCLSGENTQGQNHPPERRPNLEELINEAQDRANRIHMAIDTLEKKLRPIVPEIDAAAGSDSKLQPVRVPCPFGYALDQLLAVLAVAEKRINHLENAVQLP